MITPRITGVWAHLVGVIDKYCYVGHVIFDLNPPQMVVLYRNPPPKKAGNSSLGIAAKNARIIWTPLVGILFYFCFWRGVMFHLFCTMVVQVFMSITMVDRKISGRNLIAKHHGPTLSEHNQHFFCSFFWTNQRVFFLHPVTPKCWSSVWLNFGMYDCMDVYGLIIQWLKLSTRCEQEKITTPRNKIPGSPFVDIFLCMFLEPQKTALF